MLRNRILISGTKQLQLTLGSYSYSATPASGSTTVYAYYGGVPITDLTSSMVSKSGNMSSVSVNSSGKITMSYAKNTSTTSTKTGTMTLTYQGQTVTFTITQAKDYVASTTSSTSTEEVNSIFNTGSVSSWAVTMTQTSNGYENNALSGAKLYDVKETTTYYNVYASGNKVKTSSSSKTKETVTANIPAGFFTTASAPSGSYVTLVSTSKTIKTNTNKDFSISASGSSTTFYLEIVKTDETCTKTVKLGVYNSSSLPTSFTAKIHADSTIGHCNFG